jgi:hypothetical protein
MRATGPATANPGLCLNKNTMTFSIEFSPADGKVSPIRRQTAYAQNLNISFRYRLKAVSDINNAGAIDR